MPHFKNLLCHYGFTKIEQQLSIIHALYLAGCFDAETLETDLLKIDLPPSLISDIFQLVKKAIGDHHIPKNIDLFDAELILNSFFQQTASEPAQNQVIWPEKLHAWLIMVTQREFFARKLGQQRWEQETGAWMQTHENIIRTLIDNLKLEEEIRPIKNDYSALCVFGSTALEMYVRLKYAAQLLIQSPGIHAQHLYLLSGERRIDLNIDQSEYLPTLETIAQTYNIPLIELTETHLMQAAYTSVKNQSSAQFANLPMTIIDTPRGGKVRPTTVDTLRQLIKQVPYLTGDALFISRAPHIKAQAEDIFDIFKSELPAVHPEVVGPARKNGKINIVLGALGGALFGGYIRVAQEMGCQHDRKLLEQQKEKFKFTFPSIYSTDELYNKFIKPWLIQFKAEIKWFADPHVWITKEAPGEISKPGWTNKLAEELIDNQQPFILKPEQGKYVELERMLSSIVAFNLFYEGSLSAYQTFISTQANSEKLQYKNFLHLHKLARSVASNPKKFEAVIVMLIYSDLGKTPVARHKAQILGINAVDHDDWIEEVLNHDRTQISHIIPSFFNISPEIKSLILKVATSMEIHLGHVLHLEGGTGMFNKLLPAIFQNKLNCEALDFAFLIQMCDVAASQAQVSIKGCTALNENAYLCYTIVKNALHHLIETQQPSASLEYYINERGKLLNLNSSQINERILIRLACMLRIYSKKQGEILKKVAEQELKPEHWQLLIEQFSIEKGINNWQRNPTYIPAVLCNLAQFNRTNERDDEKIYRALQGAVCIAKILKQYAASEEQRLSLKPLCFNQLAGIAARKPELFIADRFDPQKFMLDENNNVIIAEEIRSMVTLSC